MNKVLFRGFTRHLLVLPGDPEYRHHGPWPDAALARQVLAGFSRDLFNLRTMRSLLGERFQYDVRRMTDDQVVGAMATLLARRRFQIVEIERERLDLAADVRPTPPPPPPARRERTAEESAWIEVLLLDEQDAPVAGVRYEVRRADGTRLASGTLDSRGAARVRGIPAGRYRVGFPELDEEHWVQAS